MAALLYWRAVIAWMRLLLGRLFGARAEDGVSGESELILECLPFTEGF